MDRLRERAQALAEASRAFSEVAHNTEAALEVVARRTAELVREGCTISLVSDDRRTIKMVAYHHIDRAAKQATESLLADVELPLGESIVGKVAATGRSFWVENVSADDIQRTVHPNFRAFLEKVSLRSLLCVPLRAHDEIIGTITIARGPSADPFTEDDKDFLEDLAGRAALAIANGRMFDRLQRELAERERAEAALRRTEEQLRHLQKMEAIGRLAGGIAHDFNNALSAILGAAEIARGTLADDDPVAGDLDIIAQAGRHAAALTRQLLLFSRHQLPQLDDVNLNMVVEKLTPMLRRLLPEDIEIFCQLAPGLATIRADPGQIEQVFVNLAVNARDAMPGGGRLTIETATTVLDENYAREHLSVRPGPHVVLAVGDTGRGMDADTLSHVFEPFFTTKEAGHGTGLGLAMVYGIVKRSGGTIYVYSEPGQGTTFKIHFPVSVAVPHPAGPTPRAARVMVGTETILLVDDEPLVRNVACRILEHHGHRVLPAAGVNDATEIFLGSMERIDLLLTDMVLADANGRELADRLRRLRPELKVLFMSGYTGHDITRRQMLAPGSLLLEKPFTPESMMEKVREALEAN